MVNLLVICRYKHVRTEGYAECRNPDPTDACSSTLVRLVAEPDSVSRASYKSRLISLRTTQTFPSMP